MRTEQEIYKDIEAALAVLASISPEEASSIIVHAGLVPENDSSSFYYDCFNKEGHELNLDETGNVANKLKNLLIELRNYEFLFHKNTFWQSCDMTVNINPLSFHLKFKQEEWRTPYERENNINIRETEEIYKDIAEILSAKAPENAKKAILKSEFSADSLYYHGVYTAIIRETEEEAVFVIEELPIEMKMRANIVELRELNAQEWLAGPGRGQPKELAYWQGCTVIYDIERSKIKLELSYND